MKKFKCLLLVLGLLSVAHAHSKEEGVETVVWDKAPISITIPLNQERRTDFPVEVDLYIPREIASYINATVTKEGSVFWRANDSFDKTRMMVEDKSGNTQWIIDINASKEAPTHPLSIVDSRVLTPPTTDIEPTNHTSSASGSIDYVDEVQFIQLMARQFYGPERLSHLPPMVTGSKTKPLEIKLHFEPNIKTVIRGRWQTNSPLGSLYGTAIEVTNTSNLPVTPDPNDLLARPLMMGVQNSMLASYGSYPDDVTYWYIVTDRAFEEVFSQ